MAQRNVYNTRQTKKQREWAIVLRQHAHMQKHCHEQWTLCSESRIESSCSLLPFRATTPESEARFRLFMLEIPHTHQFTSTQHQNTQKALLRLSRHCSSSSPSRDPLVITKVWGCRVLCFVSSLHFAWPLFHPHLRHPMVHNRR